MSTRRASTLTTDGVVAMFVIAVIAIVALVAVWPSGTERPDRDAWHGAARVVDDATTWSTGHSTTVTPGGPRRAEPVGAGLGVGMGVSSVTPIG